MRVLGRVKALWRFPVKSMLGEACDEADIDPRGIVGDRLYAVRDAGGKFGSGKNTRRFRAMPGLFRFRARYRADAPEIEFPDGRCYAVGDASLDPALSAALGQPVTVRREADVSHLDDGPLHLLTTASLAWLQAALPAARIDARRFRPNLLLDVAGAAPVEPAWIGRTLAIGDTVRLQVQSATARCAMVTFAQDELPEDVRVLRHIAQGADGCFGVYANVQVPGRVRIGDAVALLDG